MSSTTTAQEHRREPAGRIPRQPAGQPSAAEELLLREEKRNEPCGLLPCATLGAIVAGFAVYLAVGVVPAALGVGMFLGFVVGLWAGQGEE
ncbi:MAG: hypothetical protein ACFCVE_09715 [Phycisphaerae bacterium]